MNLSELITLPAWAKLPHINVSRQRAYQWIAEGRLPQAIAAASSNGGKPIYFIHPSTPRPANLPMGRPPREGRR